MRAVLLYFIGALMVIVMNVTLTLAVLASIGAIMDVRPAQSHARMGSAR